MNSPWMRLATVMQLWWAGSWGRLSVWSQYDTPQPFTESLSSSWQAQYRPDTVGRKTERREREERMTAIERTMALDDIFVRVMSGGWGSRASEGMQLDNCDEMKLIGCMSGDRRHCVCVCVLSLRKERIRVWEQLVRHSPEQWQKKFWVMFPTPPV